GLGARPRGPRPGRARACEAPGTLRRCPAPLVSRTVVAQGHREKDGRERLGGEDARPSGENRVPRAARGTGRQVTFHMEHEFQQTMMNRKLRTQIMRRVYVAYAIGLAGNTMFLKGFLLALLWGLLATFVSVRDVF